LKAIRELGLGSQLEAYYDRTGLDREIYPEEYRKKLPTFLVHGEFYEDPVVVAPHFRKLSVVQLEEYRRGTTGFAGGVSRERRTDSAGGR